jgi:hypothetical protein
MRRISAEEKHFQTPLFMTVSMASLRYAMGARVKENNEKERMP